MKHASVDKAKRVSSECRNNGSCPWCARSRQMDHLRTRALANASLKVGAANMLAAAVAESRCVRGELG